MRGISRVVALGILVLLSKCLFAEEVTKAQVKGLDEQVQDIKSDVLGIASEIQLLEEKLLYPSNTQVSLFVSVDGNKHFSVDSVEVKLDGKTVARHLYSFREVEALREGGVQRIYTGNVQTGNHTLSLDLIGKSSGSDYRKSSEYSFRKDVKPKFVEMAIGAPG
ncbi:MAG: hypothetical protein OEZ23_08055, partial [Gammaproteobacteria bacterium]|nr:hypothetical protein [Gammaproteobacteria bacterium]